MDSPGFVWLLSHSSWFCLASTARLIQIRNGAEHRISFLIRFSPGFVWLLSHSSWFCLASTTCLIQIRGGAEHRISFSPGLCGFFPQLVLFGFHSSLNTNPKRSGTSDFILNLILSWFMWLLSHNSWFYLASTTCLII